MNAKIQKISSEIEKTKEKIRELQTLLPELEKQKTDLENLEIIMLVRSATIVPQDFAAFIKLYQESVQTEK
jgi:prefoldin subunit 5